LELDEKNRILNEIEKNMEMKKEEVESLRIEIAK